MLSLNWLAALTATATLAMPPASTAAQAPNAPIVVAHRGASGVAPENTLAAFRLAWELGADAIEGDFYLTADDQIVCHHDKTTERTAGVSIQVGNSTLGQLQQLDVGAWKGPAYRGERIPTLEQILEALPARKQLFIEVKCGPEIVPILRRVLSAKQRTHSGSVSSRLIKRSFGP